MIGSRRSVEADARTSNRAPSASRSTRLSVEGRQSAAGVAAIHLEHATRAARTSPAAVGRGARAVEVVGLVVGLVVSIALVELLDACRSSLPRSRSSAPMRTALVDAPARSALRWTLTTSAAQIATERPHRAARHVPNQCNNHRKAPTMTTKTTNPDPGNARRGPNRAANERDIAHAVRPGESITDYRKRIQSDRTTS
jgi:hypothetical protein